MEGDARAGLLSAPLDTVFCPADDVPSLTWADQKLDDRDLSDTLPHGNTCLTRPFPPPCCPWPVPQQEAGLM